MKFLIVIALTLITTAIAQEAPDFLKDGQITVKLKNGKEYIFSSNEYMVVKRGSKINSLAMTTEQQDIEQRQRDEQKSKGFKHIISGELVTSESGLNVDSNNNTTIVESRRRIGVGLQYQHNVKDNLYIGGRVDTNGGAGLNVGFGLK
jgi:hypothetical protein